MVEKLTKQHLPAGQAWISDNAMGQVAVNRFLKVEAVRVEASVFIVASCFESASINVCDLIDLNVINDAPKAVWCQRP